jgi:hypothetical protein
MNFNYLLRTVDVFGLTQGLHFGHWVHKEKGRSLFFKTEMGGIITILVIICFCGTFSLYS